MATKQLTKEDSKKSYDEKIEKLDGMIEDISEILGYHLERIQMLESEQEALLTKLSQACNRLGI